MDTSDPDITFEATTGECNHVKEFQLKAARQLHRGDAGIRRLREIAKQIGVAGAARKYDCVLGVSGGVDSSYVALWAKRLGLRPLLVHFDNGWNSEQATRNVANIVSRLGFDLHTYVINWPEFRDLQRAYFRAGVIDIEALTDHAIIATMYRLAVQYKVRHILVGYNVNTEAILPRAWVHLKTDRKNIVDIHRRFGERTLETYPFTSFLKVRFVYQRLYGIREVDLLNYVDYAKDAAMEELKRELGWQYYGGKHYESVFTRFYQGYILPTKFGVDKRRAHLSTLIMSGGMTRDDALAELKTQPYDESLLRQDREFVLKKLGFTDAEFDQYLRAAPHSHSEFASDLDLVTRLQAMKRWITS